MQLNSSSSSSSFNEEEEEVKEEDKENKLLLRKIIIQRSVGFLGERETKRVLSLLLLRVVRLLLLKKMRAFERVSPLCFLTAFLNKKKIESACSAFTFCVGSQKSRSFRLSLFLKFCHVRAILFLFFSSSLLVRTNRSLYY